MAEFVEDIGEAEKRKIECEKGDEKFPLSEEVIQKPNSTGFKEYVYKSLKHIDKTDSSSEKQIIIMMGPPGSGKSTIKRMPQFSIKNYVNIDLDEITKLLRKCFKSGDDNYSTTVGPAIIHPLKRLAKYLLKRAIEDGMNIIFDTTGRMTEIIQQVVSSTASSGYKQIVIMVSTSMENCIARSQTRNISEPDREKMHPKIVELAYKSFIEPSMTSGTLSYYLVSNKKVLSKVDEMFVYDNNTSSPILLFKKIGPNVETVVEYPNFYNMRIITTPPFFVANGKESTSAESKITSPAKKSKRATKRKAVAKPAKQTKTKQTKTKLNKEETSTEKKPPIPERHTRRSTRIRSDKVVNYNEDLMQDENA